MDILIVDDQKDVVHSINSSIHWEKFKVEKVHLAFSAEEAKKIVKEFHIDIILCDIEMPKESGLELLEWIRKTDQNMECIFLTAHADFQYAKEALQLGSFDYLLQPAKPVEIEEVIQKACLKIKQKKAISKFQGNKNLLNEQNRLMLDGKIRESLTEGKVAKERDDFLLPFLEERFYQLKICPVLIHITRWKTNLVEWDASLIRSTLENILKEIFEGEKRESLLSKVDKCHFYYFLCYEEGKFLQHEILVGLKRFQEFVMEYMEFEVAIYYENPVDSKKLTQKLTHLQKQSKDNVMLLSKIFYDYSGPTAIESDEMKYMLHMEEWENWMHSGMGKLIQKEIQSYIQEMQGREKICVEQLKMIHTNFTKSFYCALSNYPVNGEQVFAGVYSYEDYFSAYGQYHTLMEAIEYILNFMEGLYESKMEPESDQIEKAIQYIRCNLDKNVTRSQVAAQVFLNPEYLSRLFKKRTGYLLKDFIQKEKMDYAKSLLQTSNLSISIIASKVGFCNFSHFSKVFRRAEGISPQEYRQKYSDGGCL
ncbi:response regulator [Lachnospiraceae bacterium OttesenSCG-928-D06]|nr:response regulator [Lachnospiraceae bacterium OttesenSCG-928-D06]